MSLRIQCSATELMRQSSMTAEDYLNQAVRSINKTFGPGYAGKHPDLVAQFMRTASIDFMTGCISEAIYSIGDALNREK